MMISLFSCRRRRRRRRDRRCRLRVAHIDAWTIVQSKCKE